MYNIFSSENKQIEPYQKNAIDGIGELLLSDESYKNSLLYFTMGKGKTLTAIQIALNAQTAGIIDKVFIIAPPSTHKQWTILLEKYLTIPFKIVSHQWLGRNPDFLKKNLSRTLAVVDEVHQSANRGKTLTKAVSRLVGACFASLMMSGTPFRNKEERLYVVHDRLFGNAGSYDGWLHKYCDTEPDRYAYYPKFIKFKAGTIEAFLESIDDFDYPRIFVEKEELKFTEKNIILPLGNFQATMLKKYSIYGTDRIQVVNSVRQKLAYLNYLKYCSHIDRDEKDEIVLYGPRADIINIIEAYEEKNPIVYSFSSKVAKLYFRSTKSDHYVDGKTSKKKKEETIALYKQNGGIIFATDSISTGTDGLNEVTNTIIILDDTMDGTNREQLIGRIAGGFRNSGDAQVIFIRIE